MSCARWRCASAGSRSTRRSLRAKADVAQLNVTMIDKTREVEDSLSRINGLGEAIQQDVNNAIIAMQFQDITQQQLENMRGNILAEVMRNLDTLSVETQEMMAKDIFLAIKADSAGLNHAAAAGQRTTPDVGAPARSPQPDAKRAPAAVDDDAATTRAELF